MELKSLKLEQAEAIISANSTDLNRVVLIDLLKVINLKNEYNVLEMVVSNILNELNYFLDDMPHLEQVIDTCYFAVDKFKQLLYEVEYEHLN